jgi:ATP-dependent DNA helicase DinG
VSEVPVVPRTTGLTPPASSGAATLCGQVADVFDASGALARFVPDFEMRNGQGKMAAAVARAFEQGGMLLAEAGTGTGKTLAYLVPAILSRRRVLVSTGTKNLQEQIYFKDIPAVREALVVSFTAAYMKGRSNYLCLHRVDRMSGESGSGPGMGTGSVSRASSGTVGAGEGAAVPPWGGVFLPVIRAWASRTETGDQAELEELPEDVPFWDEISATAETCLGGDCPRFDDCFVTRMRQRAAEADIVIVNHHLLFADAAVRQSAHGEVIPACCHVILDEAHQLEDVATQYFGTSVSTYRVEEFAHDVDRLMAAGVVDDQRARAEVGQAVERLRDHARAFFTEVAVAHGGDSRLRGGRSPGFAGKGEERVQATAATLAHAAVAAGHLTGALDIVESTLALLGQTTEGTGGAGEAAEEIPALVRRAGEL